MSKPHHAHCIAPRRPRGLVSSREQQFGSLERAVLELIADLGITERAAKVRLMEAAAQFLCQLRECVDTIAPGRLAS